jgi:formate hydrogenlyase subunit 6/NADH:ubiquinone oxidoreductase subunit I
VTETTSETTNEKRADAPATERSGLRGFFTDIGRAIATTFDGLSVTSSWFFRRPLTIQYPDKIEKPVQEMLPDGYRGLLEVDLGRCTGCALCQKNCPIGAVIVKVEKNAATGVREIVQFDIDIGRCMYCGLCSECCKFEALQHTTDFEAVSCSPEGLVLHFARKPAPVAKVKAGEGPPRKPLGSILAETVEPCFKRVRWPGRRGPRPCEEPAAPPPAASPAPPSPATPAPAAENPKTETAAAVPSTKNEEPTTKNGPEAS